MGFTKAYRIVLIIVLTSLLIGGVASAGVIFSSETRTVSNSVDFNNPPQSGTTTTNSTGHFEHFVVNGTATQDSTFSLVSNVWHVVVSASYNPTATVGLTTRNFTWGSTILNTSFDVSGSEQYTYTPLAPLAPPGIAMVITGPSGSITMNNSQSSSGTLQQGHYTLVSQIIGQEGDNIPRGLHYDLALTPEPAGLALGGLVLSLAALKRTPRRC